MAEMMTPREEILMIDTADHMGEGAALQRDEVWTWQRARESRVLYTTQKVHPPCQISGTSSKKKRKGRKRRGKSSTTVAQNLPRNMTTNVSALGCSCRPASRGARHRQKSGGVSRSPQKTIGQGSWENTTSKEPVQLPTVPSHCSPSLTLIDPHHRPQRIQHWSDGDEGISGARSIRCQSRVQGIALYTHTPSHS